MSLKPNSPGVFGFSSHAFNTFIVISDVAKDTELLR